MQISPASSIERVLRATNASGMPPTHVSMHGVPQACAARPSCTTGISCSDRYMIQHRIHRPDFAVHRCHIQEQQGPSCFKARAHRLRRRSLARRIAAGSSDSMTEAGPGSDSDLSQFVDLANELAEVAGSITKKFFRYSLANATFAGMSTKR